MSRGKSGTGRSGSSIDALRDGESISVRSVDGDALKIKVVTKSGESCVGDFNFKESAKSWLGIMPAKNIYVGKFNSTSKS